MNADRWKRIEAVYHGALECPPTARAGFIREACGSDEDLRREIQSLVDRHDSAKDHLLDQTTWRASPGSGDTNSFTADPPGRLAPGARLGPYEIVSRIGAGGMGQVFQARDTRLERTVAIKVSQARFSDRFAREARVIASLNHPNICTLYDVGPDYLVMELIEGTVLTDLMRKGPLPVGEALSIARQIAAALEAAHEQGIVHRDLKPANIKLRPDGSVKVLDFGLARSRASQEAPDGVTAEGMILGTPGYMSPEQARGESVDKRADIWAFGVVLCEMVTGERLFGGGGTAEALAAVLTREANLGQVPVSVRRLLAACLEKDPRRRLRDIGDVMLLAETDSIVSEAAKPRTPGRWKGLVAAVGLIAAVALAGWWSASRRPDRPLTRFALDLGGNAIGGSEGGVAISPDGRRIVFTQRGADSQMQLATRLLDQSQPAVLAGTSGGHQPFFSPDSQWIGYFADRSMNKVSVQGGAPVTLASVNDYNTGGAWDPGGNIFAPLTHSASLSVIPAAGGTFRAFTKFAVGEQTHRWPQVLPDGDILFTDNTIVTGMEAASIAVADRKSGTHQIVQRGGYAGRYVAPGYLLYVHSGVLSAVRFDLASRKVKGSPIPLVEDLDTDNLTGNGHYEFSEAPQGAGTLVYLQGKAMPKEWNVTMLEAPGKARRLIPPGAYYNPAFSPDGRHLAVSGGTQGIDILVFELDNNGSGARTRLTSDGTSDRPVWTRDGTGIVYGSKKSPPGLWWTRADGGAEPELLLPASHPVAPWSISPDGKRLAYFEVDPQTGYDLWILPVDFSDRAHPKAGRPEPFLRTSFHESNPAFSPDGRWIAYFSNESGLNEVYVRSATGESGKWQISNGGGMFPVWSPNGHELFYESPDYRIQVADYTVDGAGIKVGKHRQWSNLPLQNVAKGNYAITPDGKGFAIFEAAETAAGPPRVGVLLNFIDELKRKLP